jgi:hypothetical protein
MSDAIDDEKLRWRMSRILHSKECRAIRFKLDNVTIQTYMYAYIGDAITDRLVQINTATSGHAYDHLSNTIFVDSHSVAPAVIVHEATHAVIDATHQGKSISVGTHEASAYLAETLYSMACGDDDASVDVPHLDRPLMLLARQVNAFNASHPSGSFVCPDSDVMYIKAIIKSSGLRSNVDRVDTMNGIGQNGRGW